MHSHLTHYTPHRFFDLNSTMCIQPKAAMEAAKKDLDHETTKDSHTISNEAASRYAALRNHSIRFEDAIDPNAERVDKLRKSDIVFGRGKGFQNHPGNKRMRDIVEKYKVRYHSLRRAEKRKMVESVYKEIAEGGARFLKKVDGENAWVMVDAPVAIQKVSHTLRCRKQTDMPLAKDASGVLPQGVVRGISAPVDPESTSSQRALMQTLNNSSAAMYANLQGPGPSLASLYSSMPSDRSGLAMANLGASRMLGGFDTSQLGRLHGARLGGLGALPLSMSTSIDYYSHIRHQQLLREQMLFQQMEEAAIRNYAIAGARSNGSQTNPLVERLRSIPDQQQSRMTRGNDQNGAR
eukprot:scaffold747_cov120-Cylindrotheca_fusiformis.AAC.11